MARLLLNAEDLTRVRIAPVPDPFTETLAAAALIRHQPASPVFGWWRRSLRGKLARVRPLAAIMPAGRPGLDLRTLVGPVGTVSEGAEALRGIRRQHLHDEIEWLDRNYAHAPGPWMRLDSDLPLRRLLGSAICSFHAAPSARTGRRYTTSCRQSGPTRSSAWPLPESRRSWPACARR
jgi:hypothetical protein